MGDSHMGLQARLMSQALRKLTSSVGKSNTLIIFINQVRMKIGIAYGNPETTTGGNALKFYASIRIDIRKSTSIKDNDLMIGNTTIAKVVKNKLAPPFRIAEFDVMYGEGISRPSEIIDLGVKAGIIDKAGSWFSYGDTKIGQGKEKVKDFLKSNPSTMQEIEQKILKNMGIIEDIMLETSIHDAVGDSPIKEKATSSAKEASATPILDAKTKAKSANKTTSK